MPEKPHSPFWIVSRSRPSFMATAIAASELYTLCSPGTPSFIVPFGLLSIRNVYEQQPALSYAISAAL